MPASSEPFSAFEGEQRIATGTLAQVALAVKAATEKNASGTILLFNDRTGKQVDLDLRGSEDEILERLASPPETYQGRYRQPAAEEPRTRGRPKLGVVAREVTLLPRQWDWLATQSGGASATLRRLVDTARRQAEPLQKRKDAQEAAYHFMHSLAGDLPQYEEAMRALFSDDRSTFEAYMADWPKDIAGHALKLAYGS